jgi:xylulokinase
MDPRARGLFLGLTLEHGRADLVRAVMEGVVMACYDAFSAMAEVGARPEHIVMAGGGARSPLWRQIVADVFDLPVRAVKTGEQSALGAALLAGGGLNLFEPATMAREWAEYEAQVNPNGEAHELYSQLFSLFRGAYQKHSEDFQTLWRM